MTNPQPSKPVFPDDAFPPPPPGTPQPDKSQDGTDPDVAKR